MRFGGVRMLLPCSFRLASTSCGVSPRLVSFCSWTVSRVLVAARAFSALSVRPVSFLARASLLTSTGGHSSPFGSRKPQPIGLLPRHVMNQPAGHRSRRGEGDDLGEVGCCSQPRSRGEHASCLSTWVGQIV